MRRDRSDAYTEQDVASAAAGAAGSTGNAAKTHNEAETMTDIGQGEAWTHNLKRMVEEYQELGLGRSKRNDQHYDRATGNHEDHDQFLRKQAEMALANNVAFANRMLNAAGDKDKDVNSINLSERERTVRHGNLAADRQWNIDEVSQLAAKTPVQLDAFVTLLAEAVAQKLSG